MSKMTDKEIINRLTELAEFCRKCGNLTKENDVLNNALELINRQQAEIERLNSCVKSEDEVRAIANATIQAGIKIIKAEAIKEFAERLKESNHGTLSYCTGWVDFDDIDNLVKEMVGEENGRV